jgi:hypothetical protein
MNVWYSRSRSVDPIFTAILRVRKKNSKFILSHQLRMTTNLQDPLFFSQIDVAPPLSQPETVSTMISDIRTLMHEQLTVQNRQNDLLEKLIAQISQTHYRKLYELALWKHANPDLAEFCRRASIKLERVQTDLLSAITEEIDENVETFFDSEYALSEFVDRFGMKFLQLNSLLQILSQLGNAPDIHVQQSSDIHKDI